MNYVMLGRIVATSLLFGAATVGCTSAGRMKAPVALGNRPANASVIATREAGKATAALAAHKLLVAVDAAEKAVAAAPTNAEYRSLLGKAYLSAGRFASAGTSLRDALTLSPDMPKTRFYLALAEIAQGQGSDALPTLRALSGTVPPSDLGLALVLAGDRPAGIQMLIDLVRSGKSDARGRQNLALAFALDGRWREARAMAMQDIGPDRIEAQLAGWAALAQPQTGGALQIATMLGVRPVADPGLPTALALVVPAPLPTETASRQALAVADPLPAAMAVAQVTPDSVSVPLDSPPPAAAAPAEATAAALALAVGRSTGTLQATPAAFVRKPARVTPRDVPMPPPAPARGEDGYVVQLGAYARASAMEAAWTKVSRMLPRLAGYEPVRAEFRFAGGAFIRLSVSGFADRAKATALCRQIQSAGGQCFVRRAAGDVSLRWVRRREGSEIASR